MIKDCSHWVRDQRYTNYINKKTIPTQKQNYMIWEPLKPRKPFLGNVIFLDPIVTITQLSYI